MLCCINCFNDIHIKDIIAANKKRGTCDFCHSKDVFVIDIDQSSDFLNCIMELIQIYEESNDGNGKYICDALCNDWNIFSVDKLNKSSVRKLIEEICTFELGNTDVLSKKMIIPQLYDKDYLSEYGVVRGLSWKDFSNHIKNVNRFHSDFNSIEFASCLTALIKKYKKGEFFYRARIADNEIGFKTNEMKAPPKHKSTAGRVNPEGMPVLYLSLDDNTVLYEIRANMYDFVSIGKFVAKKDLRIVDLSGFESISPFRYGGGLERFAINAKVFQEISKEIAKPLRRNDSPLEYLPTQFIAEFIKSENYDGVEYKSTISRGGRNIALFNEELVDCLDIQTIEITDINYATSPTNEEKRL